MIDHVKFSSHLIWSSSKISLLRVIHVVLGMGPKYWGRWGYAPLRLQRGWTLESRPSRTVLPCRIWSLKVKKYGRW